MARNIRETGKAATVLRRNRAVWQILLQSRNGGPRETGTDSVRCLLPECPRNRRAQSQFEDGDAFFSSNRIMRMVSVWLRFSIECGTDFGLLAIVTGKFSGGSIVRESIRILPC